MPEEINAMGGGTRAVGVAAKKAGSGVGRGSRWRTAKGKGARVRGVTERGEREDGCAMRARMGRPGR